MSRKVIVAIIAVLAIAIAVPIVLIGGSDDTSTTDSSIDGAFLTEMTPHHQSAIEMARIAESRAEHPEIKQLAQNIVASQGDELDQMNQLHMSLFGEPVSAGDHGTLGLDEMSMGMSMDTGSLQTAKPFDRAFIDMMIPHHQGAIRMAQIELHQGADADVKTLASKIINAQSAEIEQMNQWREKWYGAPSPAGDVPPMG